MVATADRRIILLGVGNILFRDEGVGIRVIEAMQERYAFPENVELIDGGVLGLNLLGVLTGADELIVIDAVRNGGPPGTLYRLEGEDVPRRILAKNSLHQVDLLESLTCSRVLEKSPATVILGVEPADIENLGLELTPAVRARVDDLVGMALRELDRLGADVRRKETELPCA